jgi:hypothetical protein
LGLVGNHPDPAGRRRGMPRANVSQTAELCGPLNLLNPSAVIPRFWEMVRGRYPLRTQVLHMAPPVETG